MLALGGKLHTRAAGPRTPASAGSSRLGRERPERSLGRLAKVLRRCVKGMIFVSTRYAGDPAHKTQALG